MIQENAATNMVTLHVRRTSGGAAPTNIPSPRSAGRRIDVRGAHFFVSTEQPDFGGFWSRVETGIWEPETFALMDRLLAPGARFIDIGAWIGPTALYAAARGARVDAYECDPVALETLERNLQLNSDLRQRITLYGYALSDADTEVTLWSGRLGDSETSIFARHERGGVLAECGNSFRTMASDALRVFQQAGYAADASTLIKMDVEGAEFRIVPRLAGVISGSAATWYVSFHELNINPVEVPARPARLSEMLRTLLTFSNLHWYSSTLVLLDKNEVLNAVIAGTWPVHSSLVFSSRSLDA
jgi:FkbM family methyltransferase